MFHHQEDRFPFPNSENKRFNQTRPVYRFSLLIPSWGTGITYSRAGHSVAGENGVVDVEIDPGVVDGVSAGEKNPSWNSASTTGDLELRARNVELGWHRLE